MRPALLTLLALASVALAGKSVPPDFRSIHAAGDDGFRVLLDETTLRTDGTVKKVRAVIGWRERPGGAWPGGAMRRKRVDRDDSTRYRVNRSGVRLRANFIGDELVTFSLRIRKTNPRAAGPRRFRFSLEDVERWYVTAADGTEQRFDR